MGSKMIEEDRDCANVLPVVAVKSSVERVIEMIVPENHRLYQPTTRRLGSKEPLKEYIRYLIKRK